MSHPTNKRPANRLAGQSSPYLLQHAHNPVDWYPWGEEAFAEARRRNVPIFLSIGYSTCYWCHVMERESFESDSIAAQLNRDFVPVKVDREERPDVDDLYMAATQMTTGHGGWPMSVFLEPGKLRPFYCGTYYPPEPRSGMRSFPEILTAIATAWNQKRDEVILQGQTLADAVAQHIARENEATPVGLTHISKAAQTLLHMFDQVHGGFGSAPKFPQPVFLEFLLDIRGAAADEGTRRAVDHVLRVTLDKMACGGMNDQVGGGFHRYSVDDHWLVPHFEKMLYDNAQLAAVYARSAAMLGNSLDARTARQTLDYVLREMTDASGAFWSAQDAEVDGREGLNYIWTESEVRAALPADDAAWALKFYGLDRGTNFRDPHHPGQPPSNVLHVTVPAHEFEESLLDVDFGERLGRVNAALLAARNKRKQPRLDDKILASWNGLMIAAFAKAAAALNEPRYVIAARAAAKFILSNMRDPKLGLVRSSRAGKMSVPGFLEDYAFFIHGLLALHAIEIALGEEDPVQPLTHARALAAEARQLFGDGRGGFFDARDGQADLFLRPRSTHDGAIPSGASIMLDNLVLLHRATGEQSYLDDSLALLASLSPAINASPLSAVCAVRVLLSLISDGVINGAAAPEPEPQKDSLTPVEIFASEERLSISPGKPAALRLVLKIADGYHINAAQPGGEGLVPLRVGIVNGSGIAAYADYPPGEPFGEAGSVRVHKGQVEFEVAVERTGELVGRPLLSVTFQACTDRECLAPMTAELDVAIDFTA